MRKSRTECCNLSIASVKNLLKACKEFEDQPLDIHPTVILVPTKKMYKKLHAAAYG